MKSLLDLANRMDALPDKIDKASNDLKVKTARAIHSDLLTVTPVDESTALSNWVLTVDEPWSVEQQAYFLGSKGSTQSESINAGIQQGERQLALSRPQEPIFISNNAAYIRQLNDGSSGQAPAGFVERAVLFGRKTAKAIGIKFKS